MCKCGSVRSAFDVARSPVFVFVCVCVVRGPVWVGEWRVRQGSGTEVKAQQTALVAVVRNPEGFSLRLHQFRRSSSVSLDHLGRLTVALEHLFNMRFSS